MITLDTETLPVELNWVDEFSWTRATAAQARTISGKLIVTGAQTDNDAGRPITLADDNAWGTYLQAKTLLAWAATANKIMVLTLSDGVPRNVMFRAWDQPCITWTPFYPAPEHDSSDEGILSLKLVCV
jgi:hypothetical protein